MTRQPFHNNEPPLGEAHLLANRLSTSVVPNCNKLCCSPMKLDQVGCLAIALSALFEDTTVNAFVEEFRPAMWTEARKTLPKSVFEYSRKALRKALVTLRSAYGPVRVCCLVRAASSVHGRISSGRVHRSRRERTIALRVLRQPPHLFPN